MGIDERMTTVTRMKLKEVKLDNNEFRTLSSGAVALLPKHKRNFGVFSGGLSQPIDQNKLRKLIDMAVRYRARLSALKLRDLTERFDRWCLIKDAPASVKEEGAVCESYWRNKSLSVRRVSRKEEFGFNFIPELTEIACQLGDDARVLLTISENEHQARFDVISINGLSGYCLEGLEYDLALSQVLSLLSEIEGA